MGGILRAAEIAGTLISLASQTCTRITTPLLPLTRSPAMGSAGGTLGTGETAPTSTYGMSQTCTVRGGRSWRRTAARVRPSARGDERYGGNCAGMTFARLTFVYSTSFAFLAFDKAMRTAQCWVGQDKGGRCSSFDFRGVSEIYSTKDAFMALDKDAGVAFCWGDRRHGGDCGGLSFRDTTNVYSTRRAFLALQRVVVTARGWICRACVHVYGGVHGFVALLPGCPVDASRVASGGCACDPGFHGRILYSPEDGEFVGSCTACAGVTEFQNETGAEECKSCASGHFGIPKGDRAHTACDDARCQRPVVLPAQAHVDPWLCPSDGLMESFDGGTPSEATRCYLQCDRYWHAKDPSRRPFFTCKPDSHNTASYQGHVECLPDPCPDWACKNNGTVVGGNMAVGCQCRCAQGWTGDDCSVHQAPARSCPDCL